MVRVGKIHREWESFSWEEVEWDLRRERSHIYFMDIRDMGNKRKVVEDWGGAMRRARNLRKWRDCQTERVGGG